MTDGTKATRAATIEAIDNGDFDFGEIDDYYDDGEIAPNERAVWGASRRDWDLWLGYLREELEDPWNEITGPGFVAECLDTLSRIEWIYGDDPTTQRIRASLKA